MDFLHLALKYKMETVVHDFFIWVQTTAPNGLREMVLFFIYFFLSDVAQIMTFQDKLTNRHQFPQMTNQIGVLGWPNKSCTEESTREAANAEQRDMNYKLWLWGWLGKKYTTVIW